MPESDKPVVYKFLKKLKGLMVVHHVKSKVFKLIIQFIKFGMVGTINTLTSLAIYYSMIFFNANYLVATIAGYIVSSVVGYLLNRIWVFHEKTQKIHATLIKYYLVYGSSLLLNLGVMYLWVDILHISKVLAPILTLFVTIPYNFLFSKLWIFKEKSLS